MVLYKRTSHTHTHTHTHTQQAAHLVELEHSELDWLSLVLDLLGGSVVLLLPLLATTTQAQHKVERRLRACERGRSREMILS